MSILDEIVEHKREEVRRRQNRLTTQDLRRETSTRQPGRLVESLQSPESRLGFLAEVKRQAPSSGTLTSLSPGQIAAVYEEAEVEGLSVLTDQRYFGQNLETLSTVAGQTGRPRLRKDFIIDEYQVWETAYAGAEGMLLIAGILDPPQLRDYYQMARELGIDPLVEVHSGSELASLPIQPALLGINNRVLDGDFHTDLAVTERLAPDTPANSLLVSESGISTAEDMRRLDRVSAVDGVLVGTALTSGCEEPDEILKNVNRLLDYKEENTEFQEEII